MKPAEIWMSGTTRSGAKRSSATRSSCSFIALSHHSVRGFGSVIWATVPRRTCRMACLATNVTQGAGELARDCFQVSAVSLPSTYVGMATALAKARPGAALTGAGAAWAALRPGPAPALRTWIKSCPPKALAILFSPGFSSKVRVMTGKRLHFSSFSRLSRWQPTTMRTVRPSGRDGAVTVTISPGAAYSPVSCQTSGLVARLGALPREVSQRETRFAS